MKKNILILILCFCLSNLVFGQVLDTEVVSINNMNPVQRVQYLESSSNWYFHDDSQQWKRCELGSSCNSFEVSFAKFFIDEDNDGLGNPNNYIASMFRNTLPDEEVSFPIYNSVDDSFITDFTTRRFKINYNGNVYLYFTNVRFRPNRAYSFLIDCDDSNSNITVRLERWYIDNDGDAYGGGISFVYPFCGTPPLNGVNNNDDCNDTDEAITTQPINWYLDNDQDGFGDINNIIVACRAPRPYNQTYVSNANDCDDTNSQYHNDQLTWYADFDNDGFGDENNTIIAACPPQDYITNCYFDNCPTVAGTQDGCPIEVYDFDNDNKNYVYERTYVNEFQQDQLNTVTTNDVIEQITYTDGFGRATQKNNIKFSPLGKDIIAHFEYDGNGDMSKQYLPYVSTSSTGMFDENSLSNTLNYYNTTAFDNTTNPYVESIRDNSPLQKTLEVALPGEDWKKDNEHTLKQVEEPYYVTDEVRKYNVGFTSVNGIGQPHVSYECNQEYYQDNELVKTIVKDQNWSSTQINLKDNTRELFTDKFGRTVLERKFNSQAETPNHDTYYVYDDVTGNLTYVLPPKASDIIDGGSGKTASYQFQTQLSWKDIAEVDEKLATENQKTLKELKVETTKETTLTNKYGGQGTIDVLVDLNNDVIVNFDITLAQPMPLINGEITALKTDKPLKDQVLGELFGVGYHYQLYVQKNALFIKGNGKVSTINISFRTSQQPLCNLDQEVLDNLCYQYKYDYESKLREKKLPGKGWEYIIYNKLGQPALTQNAIQKENNEWSFVKYDALGRVAYTGISKSYYNGNGAGIEYLILNSSSQYETRTSSPNTIGVTDSTNVYYTNNVNYSESGEMTILTVNYYDDYIDIPANVTTAPTNVNGVPISNNTKYLPTVSKIRILDTNDWITKVSYYDDKARLIFAADNNPYLEASNNLKIDINFRGQVLKTEVNHFKNQQAGIKIEDEFTYDRIGRILKQEQVINNQTAEVIFENQYSELGKLETKGVGNKVGLNRLQYIDYKYNILGLLKSMNDVTNLGNDLFAYEINYSNPNDVNATKMYNGNISEVRWKTASNTNAIKSYTYSYDALNRIEGAQYYNTNNQNEDFALNSVSYDKNGNIYSLERTGTISSTNYDIIDDLSYVYDANSNKLIAVNDTAGSKGFKDGNSSGNDYIYDLDGKLISDANKGITQITYNQLNQPKIIYFENPTTGNAIGQIEYVYNAVGQKITKRVIHNNISSTNTNVTEYAGGFNYGYNVENGNAPKLNYIRQSEGFIEKDNSGNFNYIYQFKDHLGNIRLSYSDTDNNGIIAINEIREEHGYYPFGLKHQNYSVVRNIEHPNKFNGKELEQALGLNLYEMDFRLYDQTLGRFMVVDPLAEYFGQISISPYAFARNNPISLNDPSGLCAGCDGYETDGYGGPPDRRGSRDMERFIDGDNGVWQWHSNRSASSMIRHQIGTWEFNQTATDKYAFGLEQREQEYALAEEFRQEVLSDRGNFDLRDIRVSKRSEGFKNFDKTFNKGLGVISIVPAPTVIRASIDEKALKRKIRKAKAKGRINQTATKKLAKLKASMKGLDKFSKKLGYVGVAYNGVTLTTDILAGEEITASRLFDTGVGILFSVIAISNPIGLVLLAAYTIGDSLGAFDSIKESLGGNTVMINGN